MPDMNVLVRLQERERKMGNCGKGPDQTILIMSILSEHIIKLSIDTLITEVSNYCVKI